MLRHLRLSTLVALFAVIPAVAVAAAPFGYITNSGSGTISVIDTRTNTEVGLINLNTPTETAVPWGVAIHPDGKSLYVTHFGNSKLYVVDLTTTPPAVRGYSTGSMPFGVALHPAGSKVYVTRAVLFGNNLAIFDTTTPTFVRTDVAAGFLPAGVAVNAATGHLYVANLSGIRVFNLDGSLVTSVPLGTRGFGVAVHPDGHRFYVTLPNTNQLALIDAGPSFSFTTVGVGTTPQGVAVSPDGKRVYVSNYGGGNVTILDENGAVVNTVTVGMNPYGVQVSPDGSHVFVANWGSGSVSVIDAMPPFAVTTVARFSGRAPVAFGISMLPIRAITVGVDIMPGGNPNTINLRAQGTLPVAILGSADFNVSMVDPTSVTLAGASVVIKKNGLPMASMEDVNGDGFMDLVLHVAREGLQLHAGDTEAVLEGKTYDGVAFRGVDSVKIVP